jgi:uncharacterized membrane protein
MSALGNIDSPEGTRAMQRINIDVFSWSFSLLFFGMPVFAFILGVFAVMNWSEPVSSYYLLGSLTVTAAANVPLNNTLSRLNSDSKNATGVWRDYILIWTRWNHLMTMACQHIVCRRGLFVLKSVSFIVKGYYGRALQQGLVL